MPRMDGQYVWGGIGMCNFGRGGAHDVGICGNSTAILENETLVLSSPVPKSEGPVAPSLGMEEVAEIVATRRGSSVGGAGGAAQTWAICGSGDPQDSRPGGRRYLVTGRFSS